MVGYMQIIRYQFLQHGDKRGQLVALEELRDIPFVIKRVYYMYDTIENMRRGCHSHKNLEQILICVCGSCKVLLDDGIEKETVLLDKPYEGLYIASDMWREMYDFTAGSVLMVLASEYYNEDDYIRDYSEFRKNIAEKMYKTNEEIL